MADILKPFKDTKILIPVIVMAIFFVVSLLMGVSVLFTLVMLVWAGSVLFALKDYKNRAAYLIFLFSFFLFLLSGEFCELYFGYAQEYTFIDALDTHAYVCLFVSLTALQAGVRGMEYLQARRRNNLLSSAKEKNTHNEQLQRYARLAMYVSVIPFFLKTLDAGLYTLENGYLSYYTTYQCRLPVFLQVMSEWYTMFFFIFLATMPQRKKCLLPMGLYMVNGTLAMIVGRRISFGVAILVLLFYMVFRHGQDPKGGWISKRVLIIVAISCPVVILGLHALRYLRYGDTVEGSGILDMIVRFLSQQGFSINILKLQKDMEGDSLGCTSLYYTIHYLRGNVLTRNLFDFPMELYTQRSTDTALYTNCLADYIMYSVNAQDFFAGYGLGTSYIAELHHDLGYLGVASGSVIYGVLLSELFSQKRFSFWKFAIGLMMLEEFVILPRYGADVILRPFYNLTKMAVLAIFIFLIYISKEHLIKTWNMIRRSGIKGMFGKLKRLISTRSVMLNTPPMGEIRHITDAEVAELQKVMLQIVKDVAEVCEKHGICYMADGGTALGSVRHKGFIPWDDDVDLIMPRDDLNRFVEIFDEELGNKYDLVTPNSKGHKVASLITEIYDKNSYKSSLHNMDNDLPQGVMIDIFPLEYAPLNPVVRRIKGTIAMILQYIAVSSMFYSLYSSPRKKEFFYQTPEGKFNYNFRRAIGFLFSFRSYEKWCNTFDRFVRGKEDTGLWCIPTDVGHYFGHLMPKEVFYPPFKGPFEDTQINLPNDIHAYLVNAYGDYMWIPPVEQREKHWTVGFCMDLAAEKTKKEIQEKKEE